jgi:hypothetical protein
MDDHNVIGQAELDEEIPTFDVPDNALERAANAEQQVSTWAYCTHPWYYFLIFKFNGLVLGISREQFV